MSFSALVAIQYFASVTRVIITVRAAMAIKIRCNQVRCASVVQTVRSLFANIPSRMFSTGAALADNSIDRRAFVSMSIALSAPTNISRRTCSSGMAIPGPRNTETPSSSALKKPSGPVFKTSARGITISGFIPRAASRSRPYCITSGAMAAVTEDPSKSTPALQ